MLPFVATIAIPAEHPFRSLAGPIQMSEGFDRATRIRGKDLLTDPAHNMGDIV